MRVRAGKMCLENFVKCCSLFVRAWVICWLDRPLPVVCLEFDANFHDSWEVVSVNTCFHIAVDVAYTISPFLVCDAIVYCLVSRSVVWGFVAY